MTLNNKAISALRAVHNEQPNERQCSVQTPFRGLNTERAERTGDNIGRRRVGRPRVTGRGLWFLIKYAEYATFRKIDHFLLFTQF